MSSLLNESDDHTFAYTHVLLWRYWEDNIPDDLVPPADFDAPDDDDNGKDSSASAIVASALFEIFTATGDDDSLSPFCARLFGTPEFSTLNQVLYIKFT